MPFTAFLAAPPVSVPVPRMAMPIDALLFATVLPYVSSTRTVTAGVMVAPAGVSEGAWPHASCVALP